MLQQGETARDIATRKELTEILSILNNPVIPMPRHKETSKESGKDKDGKKKVGAATAVGRCRGKAATSMALEYDGLHTCRRATRTAKKAIHH